MNDYDEDKYRVVIKFQDGSCAEFEQMKKLSTTNNAVYIAYYRNQPYVLKFSRNPYISSLHLQQLSDMKMEPFRGGKIRSKWGKLTGTDWADRDVIVMPFYKNIITLDLAFQDKSISAVDVVKRLAYHIYVMHRQGISGFDTEFYWSAEIKDIIVLDIGPPFTFGYTSAEMLTKQLDYERNNQPGIKFIIGNCLPTKYLNRGNALCDGQICSLINNLTSMEDHIESVARVQAVDFWGRLETYRERLFGIFLEEYIKLSAAQISLHQSIFIDTMKKAVAADLRYASCTLYPVKTPAAITSSCKANADGSGYV